MPICARAEFTRLEVRILVAVQPVAGTTSADVLATTRGAEALI